VITFPDTSGGPATPCNVDRFQSRNLSQRFDDLALARQHLERSIRARKKVEESARTYAEAVARVRRLLELMARSYRQ
jgi:hypothetical protein